MPLDTGHTVPQLVEDSLEGVLLGIALGHGVNVCRGGSLCRVHSVQLLHEKPAIERPLRHLHVLQAELQIIQGTPGFFCMHLR